MRRVVVTGLGVVSPVGNDVGTFWKANCEGRSGIRLIDRFDVSEHAAKIAGLCEDAYPPDLTPKDLRRRDRYTLFVLSAADQAWIQSGLDMSKEDPDRFGVTVGSGIGGLVSCETEYLAFREKGPKRLSPLTIPRMLTNLAGADVAIRFGLCGPNKAVVSACATGAQSIGEATSLIRHGRADVMIAGGTEASITSFAVAGFCAMRALSRRNDEPQRASRPFDKDRDGFVMGEGAGAVVLEAEEHARARGAEILAEVAGYGETCDAHHITAPHPEGLGAANAMRLALSEAQIHPQKVDYFNAHGTSTEQNDASESRALHTVFGPVTPPVSSTKSMVGHLLGAAGAVEAIVCVLAIRDGILPPSINYDTPDPQCDITIIANEAREAEIAIAMSNSLGFGGHNTSIVFTKYDG